MNHLDIYQVTNGFIGKLTDKYDGVEWFIKGDETKFITPDDVLEAYKEGDRVTFKEVDTGNDFDESDAYQIDWDTLTYISTHTVE